MIIRHSVISLITVFVSCFCFSQSRDSINAFLEDKDGRSRIDAFFDVSYDLIPTNNALALYYALEGYKLSLQQGDSLGLVRTGLMAASALRRLGRLDSAILIYNAILKTAEDRSYKEQLSMGLNSLGMSYLLKGRYDSALNCYARALELRNNLENDLSQVPVLINIAVVYYKLKNYQKALNIFMHARSLQQQDRECLHEITLLLNIGHCLAYLKRFDEALQYIDEALVICGENCSPATLISSNFATGIVYVGLNDIERAECHFLESLEQAKKVGHVRFQLDNIECLARLYTEGGKSRAALTYLRMAEDLLVDYPSYNLEKSKVFSRFFELYLRSGDFERASHYQHKYIQLQDSVYNEEMTSNLMRLEARFVERESDARINAQKEMIMLKEEIIRRQKADNRNMAVVAVLFLGLVISTYRNYRHKKSLNVLLDRKIDERTKSLQKSHGELERMTKESMLAFDRTHQIVIGIQQRIMGLCNNGMKEVLDPAAHSYFKEISGIAEQLREHVTPKQSFELNGKFHG